MRNRERPVESTGRFLLTLAYGAVIGVMAALAIVVALRPSCPTEDSCDGAYETHWYGNGWTGKEVTP